VRDHQEKFLRPYILISRISRKEKIRNVTTGQQIGLEETIIKEIEQNQLTW